MTTPPDPTMPVQADELDSTVALALSRVLTALDTLAAEESAAFVGRVELPPVATNAEDPPPRWADIRWCDEADSGTGAHVARIVGAP